MAVEVKIVEDNGDIINYDEVSVESKTVSRNDVEIARKRIVELVEQKRLAEEEVARIQSEIEDAERIIAIADAKKLAEQEQVVIAEEEVLPSEEMVE